MKYAKAAVLAIAATGSLLAVSCCPGPPEPTRPAYVQPSFGK